MFVYGFAVIDKLSLHTAYNAVLQTTSIQTRNFSRGGRNINEFGTNAFGHDLIRIESYLNKEYVSSMYLHVIALPSPQMSSRPRVPVQTGKWTYQLTLRRDDGSYLNRP